MNHSSHQGYQYATRSPGYFVPRQVAGIVIHRSEVRVQPRLAQCLADKQRFMRTVAALGIGLMFLIVVTSIASTPPDVAQNVQLALGVG